MNTLYRYIIHSVESYRFQSKTPADDLYFRLIGFDDCKSIYKLRNNYTVAVL